MFACLRATIVAWWALGRCFDSIGLTVAVPPDAPGSKLSTAVPGPIFAMTGLDSGMNNWMLTIRQASRSA